VEILRRRGVNLGCVLRAIIESRLRVAGLDQSATGLKALRFRAAEVRALAAGRDDPERPLTIQEAARELGLKWQVVAHLVGAGAIAKEDGGIRSDSLDNFKKAYVSGAELAKARRTSPRHLAEILEREGVRPVVGPAVDGSRQNFYGRDSSTSGILPSPERSLAKRQPIVVTESTFRDGIHGRSEKDYGQD
jgi:hypothetical protein